ncbi:alpha-L-fucosidase [Devosia sp. FKR38]|uniref:alpha-L-fucosidase n=1 Tax=Devosia sp. FKR38 TaxID=2562312 RepID=UPI0010BF93A3|nr:alpha-L-fucosidase [Devosia sp. FKR38]
MSSPRPSKPRPAADTAVATGPFAPDWASLKANYVVPDWFRDAKFGIWAHWSAQSQPGAGDWYARNMYIQGDKQSDFHRANYGHPADVGFLDIENQWTADNWDPDALLDLYQAAGARYFVALANHHDNLDCYDSAWHGWNSVNIGPKRDIVGIWAQKARARGLKFGVSNHGAHAWHWYQTAYGYDPEGPRAGERYDAWRRTKADGIGTWWEGLDPKDLYTGPSMPMPDGITSIAEANAWHEANDLVWTEALPPNNPGYVTDWYRRCKDLIDSYQPDLIYFDNYDLPLGQAGLDIAAHFYNASMGWNGGQLQAVINTKELPVERQGAVVEDVERGFRAEIQAYPWQTDTCIGNWHYKRELFETKSYVSAAAVIHRLCDVVAKNGNLLLSVPIMGDGSIDSQERAIVEGVGDWNRRFGAAIFGSRPWRVAGEGPTQVNSGMFGEDKAKAFTAADIRFTTSGDALNALTLGAASGTLSLSSLAEGGPHGAGRVERVEVVGQDAPLDFTRDARGLHVRLPDGASHAYGVAITIKGPGLVD